MEHSFDRSETNTEHEYVVIDEAGRLQIPSEVLKHANIDRLASVDISNENITLSQPSHSKGTRNG